MSPTDQSPFEAIVFDLDGVLVDSEQIWSAARKQFVRDSGGIWRSDATEAMMGMSSAEWSRYIRDELGVNLPAQTISRAVVERMESLYRRSVPVLPGARDAVTSLASRFELAIASSANRQIIDLVLDLVDLRSLFALTVSSEEVMHGKPAPDVYLEAARLLDVKPSRCVAVEDSGNGLRSAASAQMTVVAIPNRSFPPTCQTLGLAAVVINSLDELRPELIDAIGVPKR
jgi:HAD superfamily hydrolase (TIGR01509 family)